MRVNDNVTCMDGVSFIEYKGKKILYVDYSHCKTIQDSLDVLEEVRNEYLRTNELYLKLSNFHNTLSNNEYLEVVKKYAKELFDSRTIRNAAIGITGTQKLLLAAYNISVRNKLLAFDTKEEALEYLVNKG